MGMDGVEILVENEEAFGIKFDDRAVENLVTVGDLCDLLLTMVPTAKQERCLTALAFWRLRAGLGALGIERARVRPDARIEDHLWTRGHGVAERQATWDRLAKAVGLDLPPLVRSRFLVGICAATCVGVFVAGLMAWPLRWWIPTAISIGAACLLGALTRDHRTSLPGPIATAGGLARHLVVRQAARIAAPEGITRTQVEAIVRWIIADHQGLPLERVTLGARWIDDLRID